MNEVAQLQGLNGNSIEISSVRRLSQHCTVYNIQVEEDHTYYVGSSAVWVHNADCCKVAGKPAATQSGNDGGVSDIPLISAGKSGNSVGLVTSEDLKVLRDKYGVPQGNTVAIAKINIPELEGVAFEGLSPAMRKTADLPTLDDLYGSDRSIKSPYSNPLFTRHAEEDLFNSVAQRLDGAEIRGDQLSGKMLDVKISNINGVCNKCTAGLVGSSDLNGVVRQFSERYPELTIRLTADGGQAIPGSVTVLVRGGKIVKK